MAKKIAPQPKARTVLDVVNEIAVQRDADVFFYNGGINRAYETVVFDEFRRRPRLRTNGLLILVTEGGDADAAYRIARRFQQKYLRIQGGKEGKFFVYVPGWCKSAGTLLAVGASELIIGDDGELGPLDVQFNKKDELGESQSGLIATSALKALHRAAFSSFEYFLLELKNRSLGVITTKTASEIATKMTCGMMSAIYAQVDPMHVGESGRATLIADHYGNLLAQYSKSCSPEGLQYLIQLYPSHGFVIDRDEAGRHFSKVSAPDALLIELAKLLGNALTPISAPNEPLIAFISDAVAVTQGVSTKRSHHGTKPKAKRARKNPGANAPAATGTGGGTPPVVLRRLAAGTD